ncbi:MAG: fatty acid desaturase [Cyanobacteria bacterium J06627_8]
MTAAQNSYHSPKLEPMPDEANENPPASGDRPSIDVQSYLHGSRPLLNGVAIAYTLIAYVSGVALLFSSNGWLNAVGVLLLTHGLIYSAYLSHEFMHGTIFTGRRWNAHFGTLMFWLNGACYAQFDDLMRLHIAHHVDRVDFSAFDMVHALNTMPKVLRWSILVLEWMYIPAIAFWLRWRSIASVWFKPSRYHEQGRVIVTLIIRGSLFALMGWYSPKAVVLYVVAYVGMITVLRIQDAFQHTYEVFPVGTPLPARDRTHEQHHTFSTLLSQRHPWLNLLLLNFGYHNAHHDLMKCPWHRLPELDQALFKGDEVHYISLAQQLRNYHRFRVSRIFSGQGQAADENRQPTPDTFYGAIGVSLLVLS